MNLLLPPNLNLPKWNKLEQKLTGRMGVKIRKMTAYEMKKSVLSLRTYFNEVLNPMVRRDFTEKTSIVFQAASCKKVNKYSEYKYLKIINFQEMKPK